MSVTLSLTESQTLQALRTFLIGILPSGVDVVQGQDNRVAEPGVTDFVTMTPILRERIETNVITFLDSFPLNPQTRSDLQPTKVTVQLDVHGPSSADNTQIITTMFRSDYAVDQFKSSGFDVIPLYTSEPHQVPFENAEQQIETRWSLDVVMQANPVVTTSQQFAASLNVTTIDVDVAYQP